MGNSLYSPTLQEIVSLLENFRKYYYRFCTVGEENEENELDHSNNICSCDFCRNNFYIKNAINLIFLIATNKISVAHFAYFKCIF